MSISTEMSTRGSFINTRASFSGQNLLTIDPLLDLGLKRTISTGQTQPGNYKEIPTGRLKRAVEEVEGRYPGQITCRKC